MSTESLDTVLKWLTRKVGCLVACEAQPAGQHAARCPMDALARLEAEIRADEREKCARWFETRVDNEWSTGAIAAAIREAK
jgi:hypothetical protein